MRDIGFGGDGGEAEFRIECGAARAFNDGVRVVGEGEGVAGVVVGVFGFGFVVYSGDDGRHGSHDEEGG